MLSPADRLRLMRALGHAGGRVVTALAGVLLLASLIPTGVAVTLAALVGRLDELNRTGAFAAVVVPLLAFGAVVVLEHVVAALTAPLIFAARSRIDGRHRTQVTGTAATSDRIDVLERPEVQVLVRAALADRTRGFDSTPADGAIGQLRWAATMVGAAGCCAVLAAYRWWLIPLIAVPALASRMLRTRQAFALMHAWQEATHGELHADVWRRAALSPSEGKDVRVFGFADWMVDRMQGHVHAANRDMWAHINRMVRASWQTLLLAGLALVPAYMAVTADAAGRATSIGVATAVLSAGAGLFLVLGPNEDLYHMVGAVQVLRAFDQLRTVLAEPGHPTAKFHSGPQPPAVRFDHVRFSYPDTDRTVLDGVDLDIRPGEVLAIVGLNGAGKSTLIKLLAGLYRPTSGRITADGVDLATVDPAAWREQISVVFQDFIHYQLPAADTVALGQSRHPVDANLIAAAAREAGFDSVVAGLPQGWQTPLSRSRSGGVELSGGQWQQAVLARALYAVGHGARLLVLDEPTAHLDVRTELEVFERLSNRRGQVSIVLISHRLSSVRQADRIVLLDGGRIVESGNHDELMRLDGSYAEMFTIQAASFQPQGALR
jgi:ABC-type multidrug transport system fused ATPase/permease subunit